MDFLIALAGGKVLWDDFEKADSFWKRLKGIMFRKKLRKPLVFYFPTEGRHSIHSFFCIPFDAIYLDTGKRIVDLIGDIQPNSHATPKKPAKYLIEAPAGSAARLKLLEGDRLFF